MMHCTVHRSAKMLCTALASSVYTGGASTVQYGAVHFWEPCVRTSLILTNKAGSGIETRKWSGFQTRAPCETLNSAEKGSNVVPGYVQPAILDSEYILHQCFLALFGRNRHCLVHEHGGQNTRDDWGGYLSVFSESSQGLKEVELTERSAADKTNLCHAQGSLQASCSL